MATPHRSLTQAAADLAAGRTTARSLLEGCLEKALDPAGEGARVFLKVHADAARAAADGIDRLRAAGAAPSPFAGIPISVKDLFDVAGDVTTAASKVLADAPPATRDAPAVARLKAAGFVVIGRTNMTEFAYSGVGLNPHYGTPRNTWDRPNARIPGGSSSGAAISVTDGMAFMGLGTDTGGSCRIPAALNGIVGFKPTARRIPTEGVVPLSTTLDSIGPLAATVADCAAVDAVLAGEPPAPLRSMPVAGLRLSVPQTLVLDGLDGAVAAAFRAALDRLSIAGARVADIPLRELGELPALNDKGGISAAEAYAWHRRRLADRADLYDPRVRRRILWGKDQSAADYLDLLRARADLIARVDELTEAVDALVLPTTPIVAPPIADLARDEDYTRINMTMLRNTSVVNLLDRCAISLPCHRAGEAPVGLMLVGRTGDDRRLFSLAQGVEEALARGRAG